MPNRNRYYQGPVSDHFDGFRFLNVKGEPETDRSLRDILRWNRDKPKTSWPKTVSVAPTVPERRTAELRHNGRPCHSADPDQRSQYSETTIHAPPTKRPLYCSVASPKKLSFAEAKEAR
jgi:hypothetical protein